MTAQTTDQSREHPKNQDDSKSTIDNSTVMIEEGVNNIKKTVKRFSLVASILLLVLGSIGIFFPGIFAIATEVFIGTLLFLGGIFWGVQSIGTEPKKIISWIKPLILVGSGLLFLSYPVTGVEVLVMLLSFYLLLDAVGSFTLAWSMRPASGWVWMLLNGFISALLAVMIMLGWPAVSLWILGIYVGISLFMDGLSLLTAYFALKNSSQPIGV